jgi:hypothetical protein
MKKVLIIGLVFILALCVLGCGGTENVAPEGDKETADPATPAPQETNPGTTSNVLMKVVDHFKSQGLEVTDVHEKNAEMIGAVSGLGFTIAGGAAEIYLFDPATADADLVKNLENARDNEKFLVNTREISSIMNGNIMLTGYEIGMVVHPEKDKLVEYFKTFKN